MEEAAQCAVGFALNYDGIPRTSLQNGFKLFQHARIVDTLVNWRKRKIVRILQDVSRLDDAGKAAREETFSAVTSAIHAAAASLPAPESPFPRQEQLVARMYHVIGLPGGTFAFGEAAGANVTTSACRQSPASGHNVAASTAQGIEEGSAREDGKAPGFWLHKKSRVIGEWRRRFAWISEDGYLYFAVDDRADIERKTTVVPLTAAATWVQMTGQPSRRAWRCMRVIAEEGDPASISPKESEKSTRGGDEEDLQDVALTGADSAWSLAASSRGSRGPRLDWGLVIETAAVSGICPTQAVTVSLCFETAELRDAFVEKVVEAIELAGDACFRMQPPVPPEQFGTEFLLADGCVTDHSIIRYVDAIGAVARAVEASAGSGDQAEQLTTVTAAEDLNERTQERSRAGSLIPFFSCLACLRPQGSTVRTRASTR